MSSRLLGITALILALADDAFSQESNVTCTPEFSWASNSLQQNPCEVAVKLAAPCYHAEQDIYPLPSPVNGFFYESMGDSDCVCSMVFYNLLSCCSMCQGGTSQSWTDYILPCNARLTPITIANYSGAIPNDTAVPAWAFINVEATNRFSALAAEQFFDTNSSDIGPPSSSTSSPTSSTSSSSSSSASTSSLTSSTISVTSLSSSAALLPTAALSRKSDAGAIAGGVVGGIAGVALITFALVLWMRRSRDMVRADSAARNEIHSMVFGSFPPRSPQSPSLMSRFYDPKNIATFPGPQGSPSMGYAHAHSNSVMSTGVAEV